MKKGAKRKTYKKTYKRKTYKRKTNRGKNNKRKTYKRKTYKKSNVKEINKKRKSKKRKLIGGSAEGNISIEGIKRKRDDGEELTPNEMIVYLDSILNPSKNLNLKEVIDRYRGQSAAEIVLEKKGIYDKREKTFKYNENLRESINPPDELRILYPDNLIVYYPETQTFKVNE